MPTGTERPDGPPGREPRRVVVVPGGPVLVEGPVELVTDDGGILHCDRFMVAVCACRRSRRYPLCDTSHRRKRKD
ncbi:CDGSH iron-sulfur domain-containing protein [Actinoallomurus soli]|uniref:CDGSH iron-sulfur domain-containing protein n=1 Tax=Actinoallomurus soli TaxID=2952535 RepID=UPI002091F896|nr:CDGSH iron-sulfur domain-containing protein [Actinoallomurus soli]MCO5971496.1 CDGSH iron-sulfur domain-containing protein [Actinoallomurus soli]